MKSSGKVQNVKRGQASSNQALAQIKPETLRGFHRALAGWYAKHGRHDLPWRNTDDPYPIWVSEVMLQQTQVATVRDRFYDRFLQRFPNVQALAEAPEEAVLKAWEGLGYYRRARNLHAAAKQVVAKAPRLDAPIKLDSEFSTLISLPGIGKNTAHAIMAFGFHAPVAILEANVKRVVARIFALKTPTDAELWHGAELLLNATSPFDYNQAMMDVGASICTPKAPKCPQCPAQTICKGKASPLDFPAAKAKQKTPTRELLIVVPHDKKGRVALELRDAKLLGGLYGFAQMDGSAATPKASKMIGEVRHAYSHFKVRARVVLVPARAGLNTLYSASEIEQLPLSKLDHKVLALVSHHLMVK